MKFLFIALDGQADLALAVAAARVRERQGVNLQVAFHIAAELDCPEAIEKLRADAADADLVFVVHQFDDEKIALIRELLHRHAARYQAVICVMCAPSLIRETRLGRFVLAKKDEGETPWYSPLRLIRAVKDSFKRADDPDAEPKAAQPPGRAMLTMLKNAGKIMKYIPGAAQDIHAYMMSIQYWLNASADNLEQFLLFLLTRYADAYKGRFNPKPPIEYPDVGLFHPREGRIVESLRELRAQTPFRPDAPTIGVLMLRSYLLSGNRAHYAAVIEALEGRGANVIPAYAFGLDGRPAAEKYFLERGRPVVDAVLSLTGFSLVGGPAYNDAKAAERLLKQLDVPYFCAPSLEFQTIEEWLADTQGLNRLQATLMVSIPELDGATDQIVFAGKSGDSRLLEPIPDRVERLAGRLLARAKARRLPPAKRRVGIVLFNFPPSQGNVGTAAYLDVWASLHRLLVKMKQAGYRVEGAPATADELRDSIVQGNAAQYGQPAHVCDLFSRREYEQLVPTYREIERAWGPSPGEKNVYRGDFAIMGRAFGNVGVFVQPSFGFEDDPMRLLFSQDATPNHGFAAFYAYLNRVWGADLLLHFGTHGATEFMPGKQVGLSQYCWSDRLIGDLPNIYAYCANNPSEGLIAKRRGYATLVSYLSPPIEAAGLYKDFVTLKETMDGFRNEPTRREAYVPAIVEKAKGLNLLDYDFQNDELTTERFQKLYADLLELEYSLIPTGLHTMDDGLDADELLGMLRVVADFPVAERRLPSLTKTVLAHWGGSGAPASVAGAGDALAAFSQAVELERQARHFIGEAIAEMRRKRSASAGAALLAKLCHAKRGLFETHFEFLFDLHEKLRANAELDAILRALDGRYVEPVAGGDVVRDPSILPTGRNLHAIDPYRMPTYAATREGQALVGQLLDRYAREHAGALPRSVALVLWGTDNLKSGGVGVAQALWLLGARATADEMGRIANVELVPLAELGRPRIDVVLTLSGIFRDVLPQQMRLLDRAVRLVAQADEPPERNFVRAHVQEMLRQGVAFEDAVRRIFSNAAGSYGANVNHLVDSATWEDDGEIAQTFLSRKGFAYDASGRFVEARADYERVLSGVALAFQNVDSAEMNITDIDHYYEYLGGVASAVKHLRGAASAPAVLLADATGAEAKVRSLEESVRLESRTKLLNPKWYEAMLANGYAGVSQIERQVSNTFGWSATCRAVDDWVYDGVAQTYVLDEAMRARLQRLNPSSLSKLTRRLLEANGRGLWKTDEATLERLREAYAQMEDALEKVTL
ncbi:MAG: magnesium chelatase subunit H [Chloracidobacterium sp. CP2_5A]|nr:MAG: magnesium chelatase subunit H [Chloracidobacterium sp. CP2_5A]